MKTYHQFRTEMNENLADKLYNATHKPKKFPGKSDPAFQDPKDRKGIIIPTAKKDNTK